MLVPSPGSDPNFGSGTLSLQSEQRFVLQLLTYWRSLLDDRPLPSFDDIELAAIQTLWPHCFIVDVIGATIAPMFRALGSEFAAEAKCSLVGRCVSDAPAGTLVSAATAYIAEVLTKSVPVSRGGELRRANRPTMLYRSILLPMSDDGETINGLLGGASGREVAAP